MGTGRKFYFTIGIGFHILLILVVIRFSVYLSMFAAISSLEEFSVKYVLEKHIEFDKYVNLISVFRIFRTSQLLLKYIVD
jgi:hypothetical protein